MIMVVISYPLCRVFHKPNTFGRLMRLSIELGKFEVRYQSQTTIKAQAIANFVEEFMVPNDLSLTYRMHDAPADDVEQMAPL